MADVIDVLGSTFLHLPGRAGTAGLGFTPLINVPAPGDFNTGGIGGIINDIIQRLPIPIPRPRLPAPRGPTGKGPTTTGPTLPFPLPIPIPGGLFNGGPECPGGVANPCCRGQHLDKATMTKCVSNRRMNPLNPRALRRSIRRLKGFESFVKRSRSSLRKLSKI